MLYDLSVTDGDCGIHWNMYYKLTLVVFYIKSLKQLLLLRNFYDIKNIFKMQPSIVRHLENFWISLFCQCLVANIIFSNIAWKHQSVVMIGYLALRGWAWLSNVNDLLFMTQPPVRNLIANYVYVCVSLYMQQNYIYKDLQPKLYLWK